MPRAQSWWSTSATFIEKYRVIVWALFAILLALGFDFKTPRAQYSDLHMEIQGVKHSFQAQIDTLKVQVFQLQHDERLNALIRLKCAELTPHEIMQYGVPCSEAQQ